MIAWRWSSVAWFHNLFMWWIPVLCGVKWVSNIPHELEQNMFMLMALFSRSLLDFWANSKSHRHQRFVDLVCTLLFSQTSARQVYSIWITYYVGFSEQMVISSHQILRHVTPPQKLLVLGPFSALQAGAVLEDPYNVSVPYLSSCEKTVDLIKGNQVNIPEK
jgi:hypothetical protein